ncbi:hypothetical protein C7T94_10895 [Pedobacter yulinensis]|uniref:Uncharacterized protein n=1 Tax=Pedobacter yulinensis TaxID=2126353 RepID=A0A2T3HMW5_9SPHI|nr:hypothetical protein [Pedobacter yulinensis]PST83802.1 hypothetical protein C7T94_10895 [Pedobacter yulinensis]
MEYYVNAQRQPNGDHEVHEERCTYMPGAANRRYLGSFSNCYAAVAAAKQIYPAANGCLHCCPACHTG